MVRPILNKSAPLRAAFLSNVRTSFSRQQFNVQRFRQPTRFASSSSSSSSPSSASKASSAVSSAAGSAKSAATSSLNAAQKSVEQVVGGLKKASDAVGERIGGMLGSYRQPLMYNLSVTREIFKQVYVAERLQPPTSLSTVTEAYSILWSRATDVNFWRGALQSGEWMRIGVYAVEAYGIFKIGEMLGRRSLVGYNLQ